MTVIDAAYYGYRATGSVINFVRWVGPGCTFTTGLLAAWWACDKVRDAIADRACRRAARADEFARAALDHHLNQAWQQINDETREGESQ